MLEREKWQRVRMFNRVTRLKRLLEVNAPALVIAREAALIGKAAIAINAPAFAAGLFEEYAKSLHEQIGYCTNPDCKAEDSGKIPLAPPVDPSIDETLCQDCREAQAEWAREMGLDEDDEDLGPQEITREDLLEEKRMEDQIDETVAFKKKLGLE